MLHVKINEKTMGSKLLLKDFEMRLERQEKVGFLGRNGTGKTTFLNLVTGADTDFDGEIIIPKNTIFMATSQEHTQLHKNEITTLDHVTAKLPKFSDLHHIISTYPEHMGDNLTKMTRYSEALQEFSELGYYSVENSLAKYFSAYQLDESLLEQKFSSLSGGQKRLVELVAIQIAEPHVAFLDEPTNHMDYIGKAAFVQWLKNTKSSVLVISHDRDVLGVVDRIIELKDRKSFSYKGNYGSYLYQNASKTSNAINEYEITEKRIKNINEQIEYARARAPGFKGKAGKNPWVVMREKLERELAVIMETHSKPSFWIDSESTKQLSTKASSNYHKYKAKNISLKGSKAEHGNTALLKVSDLSLGYSEKPLFSGVNFSISTDERMHIIGRNGAGKTTLIKAILDSVNGKKPDTLIGKGVIENASALRLSMYEQEIGPELLEFTLYNAIEKILASKAEKTNEQYVLTLMSNYLFNPASDREVKVKDLSGGQKARLQLIRMLSGKPNLLILDEPTNHLDLPSIEELENHLKSYNGAILYITHDSYFARAIGGKELNLDEL
jgi:ATPase subunit of ABC transporter with duplicated ATPase domains